MCTLESKKYKDLSYVAMRSSKCVRGERWWQKRQRSATHRPGGVGAIVTPSATTESLQRTRLSSALPVARTADANRF